MTRVKTRIPVGYLVSVCTPDLRDIGKTSAPDNHEKTAIPGIIRKKIRDKDHGKNNLISWIRIIGCIPQCPVAGDTCFERRKDPDNSWNTTGREIFPGRNHCS